MIYLQLFTSFFQIGLMSFGGGYAALSLIQDQVVYTREWLSLSEFVDVVTIAEMTPGPIALNASTFVGTQMGGLLGAIIATLGCITPSCIIVFILALIYFKYKDLTFIQGVLAGLRPAIIALITTAAYAIISLAFWGKNGFSTSLQDLNSIAIFLFILSIFALRRYKASPIHVILGSGFLGIILYTLG